MASRLRFVGMSVVLFAAGIVILIIDSGDKKIGIFEDVETRD